MTFKQKFKTKFKTGATYLVRAMPVFMFMLIFARIIEDGFTWEMIGPIISFHTVCICAAVNSIGDHANPQVWATFTGTTVDCKLQGGELIYEPTDDDPGYYMFQESVVFDQFKEKVEWLEQNVSRWGWQIENLPPEISKILNWWVIDKEDKLFIDALKSKTFLSGDATVYTVRFKRKRDAVLFKLYNQ